MCAEDPHAVFDLDVSERSLPRGIPLAERFLILTGHWFDAVFVQSGIRGKLLVWLLAIIGSDN